MNKLMFLFALMVVLTGCNTVSDNPNVNEETSIESLKKEVIAVHDTAMVKMNTMSQLQRKLKKSWKNTKDSLQYMDAHHNLAKSHDDMMNWMRNFAVPENADDEVVREYLREEKKAIEAVNTSMNKSIEKARFLLKNRSDSREVPDDSGKESHEDADEEHSHQH